MNRAFTILILLLAGLQSVVLAQIPDASCEDPEHLQLFVQDRPCAPIRAMNIVLHCALNPWAGLGETFAPVDDPRHNPFDWESWHESDVFRAAVERQMESKRLFWSYSNNNGGFFENRGGDHWVEFVYADGGVTFRFKEIRRTANSVLLHDVSRNIWVEIFQTTSRLRISDTGIWSPHCSGRWN